jgi:hypothetical protein
MSADEREIKRKQRILDHAVETGNIAKTCRYFGIPRSLFYVWRSAYQEHGEEGLRRKKPIANSHPNQTPDEIVENILYLRRKYHLGPIRIMWYIRMLFPHTRFILSLRHPVDVCLSCFQQDFMLNREMLFFSNLEQTFVSLPGCDVALQALSS